MTSATLSVGRDDLAYFRSRVGAFDVMAFKSAVLLIIGSRCACTSPKECRIRVIPSMSRRLKSGLLTFYTKPTAAPLSSSPATKA